MYCTFNFDSMLRFKSWMFLKSASSCFIFSFSILKVSIDEFSKSFRVDSTASWSCLAETSVFNFSTLLSNFSRSSFKFDFKPSWAILSCCKDPVSSSTICSCLPLSSLRPLCRESICDRSRLISSSISGLISSDPFCWRIESRSVISLWISDSRAWIDSVKRWISIAFSSSMILSSIKNNSYNFVFEVLNFIGSTYPNSV